MIPEQLLQQSKWAVLVRPIPSFPCSTLPEIWVQFLKLVRTAPVLSTFMNCIHICLLQEQLHHWLNGKHGDWRFEFRIEESELRPVFSYESCHLAQSVIPCAIHSLEGKWVQWSPWIWPLLSSSPAKQMVTGTLSSSNSLAVWSLLLLSSPNVGWTVQVDAQEWKELKHMLSFVKLTHIRIVVSPNSHWSLFSRGSAFALWAWSRSRIRWENRVVWMQPLLSGQLRRCYLKYRNVTDCRPNVGGYRSGNDECTIHIASCFSVSLKGAEAGETFVNSETHAHYKLTTVWG